MRRKKRKPSQETPKLNCVADMATAKKTTTQQTIDKVGSTIQTVDADSSKPQSLANLIIRHQQGAAAKPTATVAPEVTQNKKRNEISSSSTSNTGE